MTLTQSCKHAQNVSCSLTLNPYTPKQKSQFYQKPAYISTPSDPHVYFSFDTSFREHKALLRP